VLSWWHAGETILAVTGDPMKNAFSLLLLTVVAIPAAFAEAAAPPRPNVILIMTDDQGWGDFGFHGNPHLKTPNLDRLAGESIELTQFYVSPVCTPTRASLMTGRYNYRTGAIDTYLGRATMAAEETTLAELLSMAGYRTGIFGKWHLGDNYPSRAIDQGFAEALVHRGGGVGQPADPPDNSYFDPTLSLNGREVKTQGYCSDVFTDAAIQFIATKRDEPFFAYLAFNCPHTPLQVPKEYHERYKNMALDDDTAKLYGMVANIDDNIGRLLTKLEELKLADNTIVVFLTDNGPQVRRYNGILNDLKGSVHDGGIHVPCLLKWPGRFQAGGKIDAVAAHIDIVPTLLAACQVSAPHDLQLDGVNLLPVILRQQTVLPERLLFFQWHRGDRPQPFRACAVRGPRFKLVQPEGRGDKEQFEPTWSLYDMPVDPSEQQNVIDGHQQLAAEMKAAYEAWFADVSATRGYPVPRIVVGTRHENPVTLTRQDWRGPQAGWRTDGLGYWEIEVARAGTYDITARVPAEQSVRTVRLRIGQLEHARSLAAQADRVTFDALRLAPGTYRVEAIVERGQSRAGAHYIDLLAREFPATSRQSP
jgi:arylsulfatase/arylsulfatase A